MCFDGLLSVVDGLHDDLVVPVGFGVGQSSGPVSVESEPVADGVDEFTNAHSIPILL